ncbi:hypothetical protein LINGRAHAP2_LOCUS1158 [Linum grandiflorum]
MPADQLTPITHEERVGFIHYWLYKFIICPTHAGPRQSQFALSYQLADGHPSMDFLDFILANLYHGMYTLIRQVKRGKSPTSSGPLWLVRHIPTIFPFADRSLGPTSFVTTFEEIPHDGKQRQRYDQFAKQMVIWIIPLDMLLNPTNTKNGTIAEAYNPHFVARQFGLLQPWPLSNPLACQLGEPKRRSALKYTMASVIQGWNKTLLDTSLLTFEPFKHDPHSTLSFIVWFKQVMSELKLFTGDPHIPARSLSDNASKGEERESHDNHPPGKGKKPSTTRPAVSKKTHDEARPAKLARPKDGKPHQVQMIIPVSDEDEEAIFSNLESGDNIVSDEEIASEESEGGDGSERIDGRFTDNSEDDALDCMRYDNVDLLLLAPPRGQRIHHGHSYQIPVGQTYGDIIFQPATHVHGVCSIQHTSYG